MHGSNDTMSKHTKKNDNRAPHRDFVMCDVKIIIKDVSSPLNK